MQEGPLHNSRKLSPVVKQALESLLGRTLKDQESISVRTYEAHEAPSDEVREAALRRLKKHFAQVDEQLKDAPKEEHENAIEEALRSVRPAYRPLR
jgi:hypothetical protein